MILADTGFFVALAIGSDRHHKSAVAAMAQHGAEGLLTTWPVLTEATHLLVRAGGPEAARSLLEAIHAGAARVFDFQPEHLPRVTELMRRYQRLPMDLADASLVIAAETTNDGRILSTDTRDFGAYRFKRRKPFKNLLL